MSFLGFGKKNEKSGGASAPILNTGNLRFSSIRVLEANLDGSHEAFQRYYFALYHCSSDDSEAGINILREQLRQKHPELVIQVGDRFVLTGIAAYTALNAYYSALIKDGQFGDEYKKYLSDRLQEINTRSLRSESLPVPIRLTEAQLIHDPQLELLTCVALRNGQVY
jgi:hypothetical protein